MLFQLLGDVRSASDALPALQPLPSSETGVDVSSLSLVQKNRERSSLPELPWRRHIATRSNTSRRKVSFVKDVQCFSFACNNAATSHIQLLARLYQQRHIDV